MSRQHGMTLIEILVVVIIIGVVAGLAVFSLGDSSIRTLNSEIRKAHKVLQLLSEEAVLKNEVMGLLINENHFSQVVWDNSRRSWIPPSSHALEREVPRFIHVEFNNEDHIWYRQEPGSSDQVQPSTMIIFYPDGENSPFQLSFSLSDIKFYRSISSQGFGEFILENSHETF